MSSLLEIVEMSMLNDINRLSVASHNIANTATTSFKRENITGVPFDYYLTVDNDVKIPKVYLDQQRLNVKYLDMSQGPLKPTGKPLNVAIEGDGYFIINVDGQSAYTRRGSFTLDEMGRLVDLNGHIVEGESGEIRITGNQPVIKASGEVWDGENMVGKLAIIRIDSNQINSVQKDQYGNIKSAGLVVEPLGDGKVAQGYVEASNVKAADEMINTIETLRHIELNQKLIHMQQEMFNTSIDELGSF